MQKIWILILLVVFVMPVSAQSDTVGIAEISSHCRGIETGFDHATLCGEYIDCAYDYEIYHTDCFENFYTSLISLCLDTDAQDCEERTLFNSFVMTTTSYPSPEMLAALNQIYTAYEDEDFETIIEILLDTLGETYYRSSHTYRIALGISHSKLDNTDEALIQFSYSGYNPLAFYFRALAYQSMDNIELASRDVYVYENIASPEMLEVLIAPDLPLEIDAEDWIAYPVREIGNSPGGTSLIDASLEASHPVQLAFLDEGDTLAITSVLSESTEFQFLTRYPGGENQYDFYFNIIIRNVTDDYITYRISSGEGFESSSYIEGVLLPADVPDPRTNLENRVCEGLPLSFINIGDEVIGINRIQDVYMRTEPDIDSEVIQLEQGDSLIVEDGPVCAGGNIWWQISYSGGSGWAPETSNKWYQISPVFPVDVREILPDVAAVVGL